MIIAKLPLLLLEGTGRNAPIALWISIALGMAFPGLSEVVRPALGPLVFILLSLAFLRVEPAPVLDRLRHPKSVLLSALWMLLVLPGLALLVLRLLPQEMTTPDIALIVFLMIVGPPVMSAPGFIAIMGLDASFCLALLIVTMTLTPLTAPLFAEAITHGALHIDALDLALRLALYLIGSLIIARVLRAFIGVRALRANRARIDGLNVFLLFCFALAAMDGVADSFLKAPLFTTGLAALTFVAALLQIGITYLVFRRLGRADAFALAHSAGSRNMGLMVAGLGGTVPELPWLWFALGQLPIYMLPMVLKPLVTRFIPAKEEE